MGSARWDPSAWTSHASATAAKSRSAIFTSSDMDPSLDPSKITVRESVDSVANPNSTPIIIACDMTGSMGMLAEMIIKKDLGIIMQEIYDRKPVPDPHIMCMCFGDAYVDRAPLQVTQFEADITITKQVEKMFLEGGGGGNDGESYHLPWYFAAMKTHCDAILKRKRKGYLFTIGDEPPLKTLTKEQIKRVFNDDAEADLTSQQLLDMITPNWEVFHLMIKPVSYRDLESRWRDLLGERAIKVSDHEKLGEIIVSTMQVIEGHDVDKVVDSWSGDTAVVVRDAVKSLKVKANESGIVRV